jgi:hypothetical protein
MWWLVQFRVVNKHIRHRSFVKKLSVLFLFSVRARIHGQNTGFLYLLDIQLVKDVAILWQLGGVDKVATILGEISVASVILL